MDGETRAEIVWQAQQGPQSALLACPVFEVLFGGARGGGKTDGMLGEFAQHAQLYGKHAIGLMVRRTLISLQEAIERAKQIYLPIGAVWAEQKKEFTFPGGARLKFRYLDNDTDADNYQGHSYTRVYVEELTQFPSPGPIMKLMATLRSGAGVPCRFRATANPGGPGHTWVKARYIDPCPAGWQIIRDENTGLDRVFIPSKLGDNKILVEADGDGYVGRLKMAGSAELVRAWLDGDWSIIEGAFFDGWSSRNVLRPVALPAHWARLRSGDWGSARPFSFGWWAIAGDDWIHPDGQIIPRGALVRYREWYGSNGQPNVGLKLTAEEVGKGIAEREMITDPERVRRGETHEEISYGVLDPAAFAQDGGPSLAERIYKGSGGKALFRRADNKRTGRDGAMGGWDQMRARIKGDGETPQLFVFSSCRDFIRTVPVLQHDATNAEDLDTSAEDHVADEARYACMSRPYVPDAPKIEAPKHTLVAQPGGGVRSTLTINELIARNAKLRRAREND
jgi:hypothetical protein